MHSTSVDKNLYIIIAIFLLISLYYQL